MIKPILALAACSALLTACASTPQAEFAEARTATAKPTSGIMPAVPRILTESRARDLIEKAGYTDVGLMDVDEFGQWKTVAQLDGYITSITVEPDGDVAAVIGQT